MASNNDKKNEKTRFLQSFNRTVLTGMATVLLATGCASNGPKPNSPSFSKDEQRAQKIYALMNVPLQQQQFHSNPSYLNETNTLRGFYEAQLFAVERDMESQIVRGSCKNLLWGQKRDCEEGYYAQADKKEADLASRFLKDRLEIEKRYVSAYAMSQMLRGTSSKRNRQAPLPPPKPRR